MRRPENVFSQLPQAVRERFPDEIWSLLENDLKYEGYINRQEVMVERTARMEDKMIPESLDYGQVIGLKREAQIKLGQIRPATLGQAARVQGVTPADIALLGIVLRKGVSSQAADVSN